ncbi:alpha/beta hydrolase fold domain-containing protein [Lichenicoccus roseus]|uniref:Alpha/beta hydrolase n=1 Tax=Lichenicoccus roseus TaxID=2683649 RepID=A0A5R9J9U6_9PROT|nr:alpha/beta hydrolase [Lichenicoccus roseus]TLU74394.1 alpha/beta hydrolase [Lichenicoccus roseus]
MNLTRKRAFRLACLGAMLSYPLAASADDATLAPRKVPAKTLQVPTADISPGMQKLIAAPLNPAWNDQFSTGAEWRKFADHQAIKVNAGIPAMMQRMHVGMTASTIDGVRVHTITPDTIAPENRNRVLIHVHGGCYVLFPGEAGTTEAIMMAGFGHIKVISVDYRMPPEAYFPAALDDGMTVYRSLLKTTSPDSMGIFGTSAGGALTLEMVLRAKQLGLKLPGAISAGTPMSDATMVGDSFYTNKLVDNVLVSPTGFCQAATVVYAKGHDLKDPLISPVYGDMHGFPPTILTTGTRDLLLSNTVRVHRALRRAGVDADLNVFEGQSHAQYQFDDRLPETKEAFTEISGFFDRHLAK